MKNLIEQLKNHRRLVLTLLAIVVPLAIVIYAINRNTDLGTIETIPVDWSRSGHADHTSEAFTNWDNDDPPVIPVTCAKCHSSHGLLDWVGARGTEIRDIHDDHPIGTVVSCVVCHNTAVDDFDTILFPSGEEVPAIGDENRCLLCHQGTDSGEAVTEAIGDLALDTVSDELEYLDPHYHIAAATLMGTEADGAFEYDGMDYVGRFEHTEDFQSCISCHNPHHLELDALECSTCHRNVRSLADLRDIREDTNDYDGDGDTSEGIAREIDHFHEMLLDAIILYADEVVGTPIAYDAQSFPFFFEDAGEGEDTFSFDNRYQDWTPRLVRAAFNYQFVEFDPGTYSHNARYALQILYDTLDDLNDSVELDLNMLQRP